MYQIRTFYFLILVNILLSCAPSVDAQEIKIDAGKVLHKVSRYLTGACIEDVNHEIYGGLYSQMIFGESFQEPARSPSINGFKTLGGSWTVSKDNAGVRVVGTDGPKLVLEHEAFSDGRIGVEVKFEDRKGINAALIARVSRAELGADRFNGYEIALMPGAQKLMLGRHQQDFRPLAEVVCDVPVGRWIKLEAKFAGSTIEVFVDGKRLLQHDDGAQSLPAGTFGLRAWHCEAAFQNLSATIAGHAETHAFQQTKTEGDVSGPWRSLQRGSAQGAFTLTTDQPFAGTQSQTLAFLSGEGEIGIENRSLNRWGMNIVEAKDYQGYVWAKADQPSKLIIALESADGAQILAETTMKVDQHDWQRFDFTLTPKASDTRGRFALKLKQPGAVTVGHVFLQPGKWGRFKGLPVRRDVAEGLINQGITVLRYGGSMINNKEYRWKKMIGPRDRRPPYTGFWYRYSTNGWGIFDFMNFCEAAGFQYIPTVDINESAADLADFIDYAKAPATTAWGRKRAEDGHPEPYRLPYLELGNEERVDLEYAKKFEAIAKAIWAKDSQVVLVVGDFVYDQPITDPSDVKGAASRITNLDGQAKVLELAKAGNREVWFDIHIDTNGPGPSSSLATLPTFIDALEKLAKGVNFKVAVFEYNSGNNAIRRAVGNALATNRIERDGRLPVVTSANGLQPDGQNDNGWDQGLLFLNPSQVWLEPPGYVTQMLSANYLPNVVETVVDDSSSCLDATAKRSDDGKALVLQVVNFGDRPITAQLLAKGFSIKTIDPTIVTLEGPLDARNFAENPLKVVPKALQTSKEADSRLPSYTFPAYSFTILRWESK